MSTTFTNSLSYLIHSQHLAANEAGWVDGVLRGASFMNLLPIVPTSHFMRDEYFERTIGGTKLTQQRKLNEEQPAKSHNPFIKKSELTAIYYRRTDIDYRLAQHKPEVYDQMLTADAEHLVMDVDYDIINGVPTNDGYGMNGLANRVAIGSAQDVNNSATLTINTSATTFKTFLRKFRLAAARVKKDAGTRVFAFCNESVDLAIQSGRDELGANGVGIGTVDIMNQRVTHIDSIPLVVVRTDSVGTEILPFTENGESSTSIWFVSLAGTLEGSNKIPNGVTILSGDGLIRQIPDRELTQIRTIQEVDVQLRVPPRSVARLSRLLVA